MNPDLAHRNKYKAKDPVEDARESLSDLTVNPSTERYEEGSVLTDLQGTLSEMNTNTSVPPQDLPASTGHLTVPGRGSSWHTESHKRSRSEASSGGESDGIPAGMVYSGESIMYLGSGDAKKATPRPHKRQATEQTPADETVEDSDYTVDENPDESDIEVDESSEYSKTAVEGPPEDPKITRRCKETKFYSFYMALTSGPQPFYIAVETATAPEEENIIAISPSKAELAGRCKMRASLQPKDSAYHNALANMVPTVRFVYDEKRNEGSFEGHELKPIIDPLGAQSRPEDDIEPPV